MGCAGTPCIYLQLSGEGWLACLWEVSAGDQSQAGNTREEEAEVETLYTICQHLSAFGLGKVLPFPPSLTLVLVMAVLMSNTT